MNVLNGPNEVPPLPDANIAHHLGVLQERVAPNDWDGQLALAVVSAALRHYEAQNSNLESLATHDPLTGLPNRRALQHDGQVWAVHPPRQSSGPVYERAGDPLAWLTVVADLDRFKDINDSMGHPTGDRALQLAAFAFRGSVRYSTDGVYRLSGDEFAMLVPLRTEQAIEAVPRRIPRRFRSHVRQFAEGRGQQLLPEGFTLKLGDVALARLLDASFGMSLSDRPYFNLSEEWRRADEALYAAKRRREARGLR